MSTPEPVLESIPAASRPAVRWWDVLLAVVFVVASFLAAAIIFLFAPWLGMVGDFCSEPTCSLSTVSVVLAVLLYGPGLLALAGLVFGIVQFARKRTGFLPPLIALGAIVLLVVVSFVVVWAVTAR